MEIRVGQGIDIHRLEAGRKLVLGGVEIPYERGLRGHSDADVLLHAITDALLGAAGLPDIGTLFRNDDSRWKDIASTRILESAWGEVSSQGWKIQNLDCTVIAEAPKLMPHVVQMKECISRVLGISVEAVGIKAGTNEGLGALGRGEGICAFAVALLTRS